MKLTERQVRIVNAFLRDCWTDDNAGPESARTQTVTRIRRQLREELARRNDRTLRDDELIRLLNRIQFPERAAKADEVALTRTPAAAASPLAETVRIEADAPVQVAPEAEPVPVSAPSVAPPSTPKREAPLPHGPLASSQRVWLGVCIALAEQIDQPLARVRSGFVVAGVLLGPVAVAAYLVMYAAFYLGAYGQGAPRIETRSAGRAALEPVVALAAMGAFFVVARVLVDAGYRAAVGYTPELGTWSGLAEQTRSLLVTAGLVTIPFATLSGLPIAPPWDKTLPRLVRIVLACVGGILALGLASYLAGALIDAAQNWSI